MGRPEKQGIDYFPLWRPQMVTKRKFTSMDFKVRLESLRNSSSAFIKRIDVRKIVFNRDSDMCVLCGAKHQLSIDHVVSVYRAAMGAFPIEKLNTKENLQTLCRCCNSKKNP